MGPNQLRVASSLTTITIVIIALVSPLSYPISYLLICFLGKRKKDRYDNSDLKDLIKFLWESGRNSTESHNNKSSEFVSNKIIEGVIDLRRVTTEEIMQNYENAVAIDINQRLTKSFINQLREDGYSRYPVYRENKHHVLGVLIVKKLIGLDRFDVSLNTLRNKLRRPLVVSPDKSLLELMIEFKKGNSHFALVTDQVEEVTKFLDSVKNEKEEDIDDLLLYSSAATIKGIVTLEDVMEKALGMYF